MTVNKPYTFVAGTKARAEEVNTDFDVLYTQVNTNISDIARNKTSIENLDNNKADLHGSASNTFAVANPESSSDAMNKQTFFKQIANIVNYIGGLTIGIDSNSPSNTIIVYPGACYDREGEIILKLDNSTSKQNTSQTASTTYYIYIVSNNANGTNPSIVISTNSTQPGDTPPTLYRRIGYYTSTSSNTIDYIYDTNGNLTSSGKIFITTWYQNGYSGYVLFNNGFKIEYGQFSNTHRTSGKGSWQYFPVAYIYTPVVVATVCTDDGYITEDWRITDVSKTRFKGRSSEDVIMNWISIGV